VAQEPLEPGDREAARVVLAATTPRLAALALRGGDMVVYDLPGGKRFQWPAPASPVVSLAVDPIGLGAVARGEAGAKGTAATAPVVLLTVAGPGSSKTTLYVLRGDTGILLMEMRIPGRPVALLVAQGRGLAYVITGSGSEANPGRGSGRWTLRSVDLATAKVEATLSLTGTVYGAALSADANRILVGLDGGIRTFTTSPLQSSWMLRSPGRNRILIPSESSGAIVAVRDTQLAVLNPDRLPARDPETGASPDDDAIAVVELPFVGRFMDVSERTSEAVVLDARGSRMATVDLDLGKVSRIEQVPDVAAATYHPTRDSLLLFQLYAERVFEMLHNPPDRNKEMASVPPAGQPGSAPSSGPVATHPAGGVGAAGGSPPVGEPRSTGAEASAAPQPGAASAGSGQVAVTSDDRRPPRAAPSPQPPPAPRPEADAPAPGGDGAPEAPGGSGPVAGRGDPGAAPVADPGSNDATAPGTVPPAAADPAEAPPPATGPLRGRITGDLGLVEAVVFYGPEAILKEHARIRPAGDGSFEIPEPPPGRYRVVVEGFGGAQVRCSPAMRLAMVGEGPVQALDFEVSGRVRAGLKPQ
jgi:hypothetical protein